MTVLHDPVALVQANLDEWGTPYVELDTFGSDSAEEIVATVGRFCHDRLGSGVAGYLFYSSSIGSTHGVRLEDGREVVIKARPPAHTNPDLPHDRESLETICRVMGWLRARGYPCPSVLLGPTPLGLGLATVEAMLLRGSRGDAYRADCRTAIARGLAELVEILRGCPVDARRLRHFQPGASLYPQPHGKIFDFERTAAGAEWIDDIARRARALEGNGGVPVLGHADWRVEHLRFDAGTIVATYDWDSLAFRPETDLVASSAHGFTADWSLPDARRIPTGADIRAYVAEYEEARGRPFSGRERRGLYARCVYSIAYGARCQHSLEPHTREWGVDTFPHLLHAEAEAFLAEATGIE